VKKSVGLQPFTNMDDNGRFRCKFEGCNQTFSRVWNYNRHYSRYHSDNVFSENCLLCGKTFTESGKLQKHLIIDHGPSDKFYQNEAAFQGAVIKYRLNFDLNQTSFNEAQSSIFEEIRNTIRFEAAKSTLVKVSLVYICQMSMVSIDGEKVQTTLIPFRASSFISNALKHSGLSSKIKNSFREQDKVMEEFCDCGSNWVFDRAVAFDIEIAATKPIVVGNSSSDNDEKKSKKSALKINNVKNKLHLFNPKNNDNKCFLRCIHFLLKTSSNFEKWEKTLNLKNINFPINIRHIRKFEKQNKHLDVKINILFKNLNNEIFPFECGIGCGSKVMNLLLIETPQTDIESGHIVAVRHFLGIKNVNKFLSRQYEKTKDGKKSYEKCYYCVHCFNKFTLESSFKKHEELCLLNKPVLENVTSKKICFENFENQHFQDYVGFLDFECSLAPGTKRCEDCTSIRCKCDKSFSEIINHQEPIAFSFLIVKGKDNLVHEYSYIGEKAADVFIDHLIKCYDSWVSDMLKEIIPINMTEKDNVEFEQADVCYLCKSSFTPDPETIEDEDTEVKCRDHNHFTGEYLGAACQSCNLNRQRQDRIPIFVHNGSRYDFHFIIKALNNKDVGKIKVLPFNGEHFRTITIRGFKFMDSLAFLQSSLSRLSEDLQKTDHDYSILKQTHLVKTQGIFDQIKFDSVLGKSFFPYEYCTSLEQMKNTSKLPKRKCFYSELTETCIEKGDHAFAKSVWKMFDCENLLDYTKIYCKIDTVLLAEIFQKFRSDMHRFSGLDPSHYISLPAYSFDSMLKITNCVLDQLGDINMVHFLESAIRGGVSFINTRYLKVQKDSPQEIIYIDANVSI